MIHVMYTYLLIEDIHAVEESEFDERESDRDLCIYTGLRCQVVEALSKVNILQQRQQTVRSQIKY